MLQSNLKKIKESLSAILLGYSIVDISGTKAFIKHHGYCDLVETDFQYELAFQSCLKNNIYTEKQKIELGISQKLWSHDKSARISFLEEQLNKLISSRQKTPLSSQKRLITKDIGSAQKELDSLLQERASIIGITAEMIATKRSEDFYIFKSFYKDSECKAQLNKDEEFDIIDDDYMESLRSCYFSSLDFILNNNIRHVALSESFMSLLHLTENPYEVLGKPLASYTFYQKDLISYGVLYKRIFMADPKPPESMRFDPDELEKWMEKSYASKKLSEPKSNKISNPENSGQMIFGATQEDIKEIFGDENVINVGTEIKKKGGMNMKELMKLHGVV